MQSKSQMQRSSMDVNIMGGLGHVGLPLAAKLASFGHTVRIHDPNGNAVVWFMRGEASFHEPGLNEMIKKCASRISVHATKAFRVTGDVKILATSNTDILALCDGQPQKLPILVRQTVGLGELPKLLAKGWDVIYIPERIAQGKALQELDNTPQLIGRRQETGSCLLAESLFSWTETIPLPLEEAVFAKLMCNFYRYGTFALANQLYITCQALGFDFNRIREAATCDYPRLWHMPRAGWSGGFCLPKD